MPYLLLTASHLNRTFILHEKSEHLYGGTFIGYDKIDTTKSYTVIDASPVYVLNQLEKCGYTVMAMTSNAEALMWTLHKP
jgi:hypothetical protein